MTPEQIASWEHQQREKRALGLLTLSKQRRLELLPNWSWDLTQGRIEIYLTKGSWVADCGWYVKNGQIVYQRFELGKVWSGPVGRECEEIEEMQALLAEEWGKVKERGWTAASILSAKKAIKRKVESWERFTFGDFVPHFKNTYTELVRHWQSVLSTTDGQSEGKQTILSKLNKFQVCLANIDAVVEQLGRNRLINGMTQTEIDQIIASIEDLDQQATFTAFMQEAQFQNAWTTRRMKLLA
jgi:hypothetical protein